MSRGNRPDTVKAKLTPQAPQAWWGMKGQLFAFLRFIYLLNEDFTIHQGSLRAAGLTYITALSMIPVLAIAFAILKGLGAQNSLEPVLQQLAGDSQETISRIIAYVNNTNFKSIGAIGVLALVTTAISLLGNIELAFNTIWGVKETRSLQRRFSDYLSVVVVGPILILVATSITSSLQNQWVVKWLTQRAYFGETILFAFKLTPYISLWVALIFLYIFIPNTKVRFKSALLGGIVAGTAWQVAQWAYFHFQVGVANYNAIYGTLAALPIFLVWIYTSWMIVLYGVEIVRIHQHRKYAVSNFSSDAISQAVAEERALALLVQACRHFLRNGPPPNATRLARELALSQDQVEEILQTLAELGYIASTAGNPPCWLPAREPSRMEIGRLLSDLRGNAESDETYPLAMVLAGNIIRRDAECSRASLAAMTMADLVDRESKENTSS
jgi:membrane protein